MTVFFKLNLIKHLKFWIKRSHYFHEKCWPTACWLHVVCYTFCFHSSRWGVAHYLKKEECKNELFSFGVTQQGLVFFVANFPRKKKKLLKWRICKLCLWSQDLNFQEPSVAIEPIFNSNMAKWPPDIIVWHIIKAALSINFSSANFTT